MVYTTHLWYMVDLRDGGSYCFTDITHRPCGLPGVQHRGFPVVEHEKRNCRKYCVYAVFSAFGFRVFRVLVFRALGL